MLHYLISVTSTSPTPAPRMATRNPPSHFMAVERVIYWLVICACTGAAPFRPPWLLKNVVFLQCHVIAP